MADELKASPQEPITGALAKALGWMAHPTVDGHEIKPHLNLPSLLLPLESGAKFFENRSYGKPWTTGAGGLGGTQNLAPDVRDFAMDVAPYAPDMARLAGKGAKAIGKGVGEAMSQFAPSGSGPKTLTSQVGAIKPKGGNWFKDEVERGLGGLKQTTAGNGTPEERLKELEARMNPEEMAKTSPRAQQIFHSSRDRLQKDVALNNWIDKNLTNYVKNQMGTPEDPVRKLAEEGIVHKPFEDLEQYTKDDLGKFRAEQGFPPEGLGKSPEAQAWENESDLSLNAKKAKSLQELPEKLAQAEIARKEAEQAKINLDAKLTKHLESKLTGVTDQQIKNIVNGMGFTEKERMIGDDSVTKAYEKLQKLQSFDDEYNLKRLENNPWINKVAPETNIYSSQTGGLGFDHIIDVLKEDVANGRLHHDNLKNVSMEQAVRRTHEYDQEMAKKMAEAQFKVTEGMPVHKEYPEGYKWIELAKPKDLTELPEGHTAQPYKSDYSEGVKILDPKGEQVSAGNNFDEALKNMSEARLEQALKYEGDTMGHCVGGYCPDVLEGRSRIFSLRDAKGEPHVTIETHPKGINNWKDIKAVVGPEKGEQLFGEFSQLPNVSKGDTYKKFVDFIESKGIKAPEVINQIKGKQNLAPIEKYLPYVQDFVKSGDWGDVGDLHNTGLQKIGKEYLTQSEADAIYNPKIEQANKFLDTHPAFEPLRQANNAFTDALHNDLKGHIIARDMGEYQRLERAAGQSVHPDIPYTLREMKAGLNSPEDHGDKYEILDRRLADVDKLRQIHGDVPPVEPTPEVPSEVPPIAPPETPQFKSGGAVTFTDNPDAMMMEVNDRKFANGGESNVKQTPQQWIQGLANQPTEPWHPLDELTSNLQGIANLPSRMYEGAKSLYNDPMEYLKNIKAPTAEQVAMGFNPAGLETGLAGMAEKVGNLKAIDALFPNKTENMLTSAEKSALTKYKKDLDVPAVMRRELFRTTGTGDIETPSLKMRPEKGLSPDYLLDKYVVPILWDTSGTGTNVSQIAGVPLSQGLRSSTPTSVQKQGGRLYPLIEENAQQGVGGSSMASAASSKVNNLNTYSDKGPTVGVVMDMAEHGIDFSHHIAEPYIGMLNALRPSNDALKAFKQAVRETPVINPITGVKAYPYTKFPGIDSPNIREIISKGTNDYSAGNIRKAIAEVGDTYAMEKLGFPKWSDIYKAMSMPDAKTGQSAKTILEVNPNTQLITPNFEHGSYNTGIGATYAGGLADVSGNIVGVPDTILLKRLFDERLKQGKTIGNVRSSLLKSHHGQLMTAEDVARLREYLGYDKPKKAEGGEVHMAGGGKVGLAKSAIEMMEEIMAKIGQKAIPVAEAEANKAKFLEPSKIKARMFHGSKQPNITEFKTRKQLHDENFPDDTSNHYADERDAVFLSPESDFTKHHSVEGYTDRESGEAPTTYPVHVQAKNPFDFEIPEHRENLKRTYADMYFNPESDLYIHDPYDTESAKTIAEKWFMDRIDRSPDDVNNWPLFENPKIQEAIKDMGHDSFYINERGTKNLGVFDPNKIKSAIGNQGTYDITNPDINKKNGGEVRMAGGGLVKSTAEMMEHIMSKIGQKSIQNTSKIIPKETNYVTKQDGPFYRVTPKSISTSTSSNSGARQKIWGSDATNDTTTRREFGSRDTPLFSHEGLQEVINNNAENLPRNLANKKTQEIYGKDYQELAMPDSSLVKQAPIARAFMSGANNEEGYKNAIFNAYLEQHPELIEQTGSKNYDDLLKASYEQLAKETKDQFKSLPFNFSFHQGEGTYPNSASMNADVHGNNHIYVFQGGDKHDFLNEVDPETGLNTNEMFRAVHDIFGHGIHGNQFGPKGEEIAWGAHHQMYSPLAIPAMTAETRGQNSVVNYSPLNADIKSAVSALENRIIDAKRERNFEQAEKLTATKADLLTNQFRYAPQASVLLPPEMLKPEYSGGMPDYLKDVIKPDPETKYATSLYHFSHDPNLSLTNPEKYGTGIKGQEAERLEYSNAIKPRTYFYTDENVKPEVGLGSNRYKTQAEDLYNLQADPLNFFTLAKEANRQPFTAKYNAGVTPSPQSIANDVERLAKEYGYSGVVNPSLSKPAAAVFKPMDVKPYKIGGEVHMADGGGVPSMEYEPEQVPVDFYKHGNKMMTGDADISMGGMGLASNLGNDSLSLALNSSDIKKYIGDRQMMNALMANYAHNMDNTKLMANVMAPQGTPVKNINLMASTPVGGGTATIGAHGSHGFGQKQLNALSANYNLPLEHGNLNANVNRSLADKKNTVNLNYVMPFKNGGAVHMAGGGSASKALEAMLAEAPELANTIRGLFKAEAPTLGSLVDKLRTPDRQSVLPMPNRWFLDPENHPEVQGLVQKVLDANGMNRSDFHSGAYVDPKTGKIIDTQIHNDVGVAIDPITNRPVMTTGGVSGMEQLPSNWRDVGSATKSNLVKQGKFQPVGGDPILNDIGFLSTIEKSGAGHKYGLGMEYANPTMLHNTLTGDNPTLRPQSYGDLFGIGDVVGKIQTTKTGPIHDVYEKLLVAPKGSDVNGVKLNKKNGGKVTMTTNPDAMQMELHNKAFKRK